MIKQRCIATAALVVLMVLISGAAQIDQGSFDLSWHTIDGGGGTSVGDVFQLSGTVGQFDATTSKGGEFELQGGFWGSAPPVNNEGTELTNFSVATGFLLDGTLEDLLTSDDLYVHTRSGFGVTLIDLHNMEMIVNAITTVDNATTIDLTFESRIDEPAGLAQIRLFNWNTGQFQFVGTYSIGNTDQVDVIAGIDATNYVNSAGNSEIDLSIKHLVFVPFLAFTFESSIDQIEINVN